MNIRIISGTFGSRQLETPQGFATHPMGERVRGALFNSLGTIAGLTALDPFAGSGALSFEAISRGAQSAIAIERDRNAQRVLEKNIQSLGLKQQVQLIKATCLNWSKQHPDARFDLILCDPPYNDLQLSAVSHMATHLQPDGLLTLSFPAGQSAPQLDGLQLIDQSKKPYSGAQLAYYRK